LAASCAEAGALGAGGIRAEPADAVI